MEAKKLTQLVKLITSIATVFLFLLVSIIIFEYIKINSLNKEIEDVTKTIAEQEQLLYDINNSKENHSSSIYMEDVARRELGHLDENEVYIKFK